MKRTTMIPALLLSALIAGSFLSCGKKDAAPAAPPAAAAAGESASPNADVNADGTVNNPESVKVDANKLVFWSLFSGGDGSWMDRIITDYNQTGPSKQVQSIMLVWADYYIKLGTAVAARRGPDIGISHISRLPELVEQGMVIPVDDYAAKAGINWSDFAPAMVDGITFEGKKYAVPLDTHAEITYINTDIIQKAGITLENGKLNINSAAEFVGALERIKAVMAAGQSVISLPQAGDDPYRIWWATYFQMGGTPLVNAEGTQVTLNETIAVQAAETVKSLFDAGYILPGITDHGQFFQNGNAALFWGGTWTTGMFSGTQGLNFSAQPFPRLFGINDACWADAHVFVIPTKQARSEADTQAAVDFTAWAVTKGAATWAQSGQIPANIPVQSSPDFTALPYRADYARAASTAVLPSKNVHFGQFKDAMIRNLDLVWGGQTGAAEAVKNISEEIAQAIKD